MAKVEKLYKLVDPMYGFDKYCKARSARQAYTYFRYVLNIVWADMSLIKLVETPEVVEDKPSITYSDGGTTITIHKDGYTIVIDEGEELDRWKDED